MAGAGDRQEFGDAFDDAEQDDVDQIGHGAAPDAKGMAPTDSGTPAGSGLAYGFAGTKDGIRADAQSVNGQEAVAG
ncbi:hypothetical protein GCM10027065_09290 [Rhodanobacter koreensis]